MTKGYPTQEELNSLWYYRLAQIAKWGVIIAAIFAPLLNNGWWYFDGIISAISWYLIFLLVGKVFKYIIYGKAPNSEKIKLERKKMRSKRGVVITVVLIYLSVVLFATLNYKKEPEYTKMVGLSYKINGDGQRLLLWSFEDGNYKNAWNCYEGCQVTMTNNNSSGDILFEDNLPTPNGCDTWYNIPRSFDSSFDNIESVCAQISCADGKKSEVVCWENR